MIKRLLNMIPDFKELSGYFKVNDWCDVGDKVYLFIGDKRIYGEVTYIDDNYIKLYKNRIFKCSEVTSLLNQTYCENMLNRNIEVFKRISPDDFRLSLRLNLNVEGEIFDEIFHSYDMVFDIITINRILDLEFNNHNCPQDLKDLITREITEFKPILIGR